MDTCVLIIVTTLRMATAISDHCNTPTYCSFSDGKNVCVKRQSPDCATEPSQTLYTCTKANGEKYQWDGKPTKIKHIAKKKVR